MDSRPVHVLVMEDGVLAREENRDEHAEHLVVGQTAPVLVPRVDERLEHVRFGRAGFAARLNDLVEDRGEVFARLVSLPVRLDGRVREEHRQRHHALVQVVHQRGDLGEERLANLAAEQTPRRGEHDEL
jgi:hypothetical protein